MRCVKTGAHAYLSEYGLYARGDMHVSQSGMYVFRISQTGYSPISSDDDFTINKIDQWFDRNSDVSTLIAIDVIDHSIPVGEYDVNNCQCNHCVEKEVQKDGNPFDSRLIRMFLCPTCGNKRCPHATFHGNACTGSNDPGQPGSSYPLVL